MDSVDMTRIELRRQPAEHFFVRAAAIIGFDKFRFTLEIAGADVFADRPPGRGQLRERRRKRLYAQPCPVHRALEEQRIAESFAVIGADIDKHAAALAAKEMLKQEPVLPH